MADQVPNKSVLRKLTDVYCRHKAHFRFLNICIQEGLTPKGLMVRFGLDALPNVPHLKQHIDDTLRTATLEILYSCKNTYHQLLLNSKTKLDEYLYHVAQMSSFEMYESTLRLYHSFFRRLESKYWSIKRDKLKKLRNSVKLVCNNFSNNENCFELEVTPALTSDHVESGIRERDIQSTSSSQTPSSRTVPIAPHVCLNSESNRNASSGNISTSASYPSNKKRKTRRFKKKSPNRNQGINFSFGNIDKSVVNLSDVCLTEDQKKVLSLGPKFCPTPQSLDIVTVVNDVEEGCRKVRLKEFHFDVDNPDNITQVPKFYKPTGYDPSSGRDHAVDAYCAGIVSEVENHVPTNKITSNLQLPLKKALSQLRKLVYDRAIRISKADKGGAVVVQNTEAYICEANRQLSNTLHYEKLESDPTVQIAKESNKIIYSLYEDEDISPTTKTWAIVNPNLVRPQQFYHLPKIHKTLDNPPGRPIISGVGGPTEKLSKLVDHWLIDLVTELPSYVKDSTHMLNIIQEWNLLHGPLPPNTRIVTIDVVGLFTNIPHSDMELAVRYFLDRSPRSDIPASSKILDAMNHILKNNTFVFESSVFKQVHGTAMGTPMAPSIANLFMGWLEERILADSPVHIDKDFWKRFIDDIILLWTGTDEQLKSFENFINSYHPTIKFTIEASLVERPYLDILVKLVDGFIHTDLYTKPTDAHAYLHFSSCHPRHCKENIPYSQMLRIRRICSKDEDFKRHTQAMSEQFKQRGYSARCVSNAIERVSSLPRASTLEYKEKVESNRVPFVITHNPRNPPLRQILKDKHPTLHLSEKMRLAMPLPPVIGERNCKSLRDILMPSILPVNVDTSSPGSTKCTKGCVLCKEHLVETSTFSSDRTGELFHIRHRMSCNTENVIYLLFCNKCKNSQYVGETGNTMKARFAGHRSDIRLNKENKVPHVIKHFNSADHCLQDMRCLPIERVFGTDINKRKTRERFWFGKLQTVYPGGLNELE